MPIEIRELVIRAEIVERPKTGEPNTPLKNLKAQILAECLEEVRKVLREHKER